MENEALPFSPELGYVLLLFALFVLPRFLQRLLIPTAITSVALGMVSGIAFDLFVHDPTVSLLSTLGISALFLFAGLDVDFEELHTEGRVVIQHVVIMAALLAATAGGMGYFLHLGVRPATLVALALVTPSTGFILDSLRSLGVTPRERFWIKSKAIAWELVALVALFVTLQSTTWTRLLLSFAALGLLIGVLPVVFRVFAVRIAPYAPKSEFAFLLMVAVVSAYATRALGAYYLIGAFVVGMAARRFRERLPAMASEEMLHAVEVFASFFVPFYFFHAGLLIRLDELGMDALILGLLFLGTMIPLRIAHVAVHRRLALRESVKSGVRIGTSMVPTLVFTLVIATILRDEFQASRAVFGGLMIYTLVNTLIPGLVLRVPPPAFEELHFDLLEPPLGPDPAGDQGAAAGPPGTQVERQAGAG